MNDSRDPVDSAFDALRSQRWAAGNHNLELEDQLMQEFNNRRTTPRFARSRTLLIALGVVTLGGVAFAASGGVAQLKNWFVTVEINGEVSQVQLDENGENTFTVDNADGSTATVHIQKSSDMDNDHTSVRVSVVGDGEHAEDEEVRITGKRALQWMPEILSEDVLGDAEPFDSWMDEDGTLHELFIIDPEDGAGSNLYIATTDPVSEETAVTLAAQTPMSLLAGDVEPEIELGDDGTLTIRLDDGLGRIREMKLMIRHAQPGEGADLDDPFHFETPDGNIKVVIEGEEDEEM